MTTRNCRGEWSEEDTDDLRGQDEVRKQMVRSPSPGLETGAWPRRFVAGCARPWRMTSETCSPSATRRDILKSIGVTCTHAQKGSCHG